MNRDTRIRSFWRRVDKQDSADSCWLWRGARSNAGYGVMQLFEKRRGLAHRFSYEIAYGSIPAGLSICHKCDNPLCVRPDHLFAASQRVNIQDAKAKGRLGSEGRKLSKSIAEAMRQERRDGAKHFELAEKYHVHPSTVRKVLTNRTYV